MDSKTPQTTYLLLPLLPISLVVAANGGCGGQVGEEQLGCLVVESQDLELSAQTPLGFSAQDLWNTVKGERTADITWADGRAGTVTVTVGGLGQAEYQRREWKSGKDSQEIEIDTQCGDVVALPITLTVETDDGSLSATIDTTLIGDTSLRGTLTEDLDGLFDPTPFAPSGNWESIRAWLDLEIAAASLTGNMAGLAAAAPDQNGSDSTVSATGFAIATIGPKVE